MAQGGCNFAGPVSRLAPEDVSAATTVDGIIISLGEDVTLECRRIEPGEFVMGRGHHADNEEYSTRYRPRPVQITRPFYIGIYEVTQEQYETVMGSNPSYHGGADRPVNRVSWNDAVQFCEQLSALTGRRVRLPTEAEWEYACRAGTTTHYSFGDDPELLGEYAWYEANSGWEPHAVGQKLPNPWGLYDMHGNVREWCSDWAASAYNDVPVDPKGPPSGRYRGFRGGAYDRGPHECCSFSSDCNVPRYRFYSLGFRIVVEAEGSSD